MNGKSLGTWIKAVLTTAVLLAAPAVLWADAVQEFLDLLGRFNKQHAAGQYRAAEQTALTIRRLAEGPLKDRPMALAIALNSEGIACWRQGRYAEAEPLYQRAASIAEGVAVSPLTRTRIHWRRGELLWETGRRDDAVEELAKALERKKGDRSNLYTAPFGPFRQIGPVPFFHPNTD